MNDVSGSIIDGRTKLYGVIGDPIEQIRGPQLVNPIFRALGSSIVCVPMHVAEQDLRKAWGGLCKVKNLVGLGVTAPHKAAVVELCDALDHNAERVGAVNCIKRDDDGTMRGTIFDGTGFVEGLHRQGHDLAGKSMLLLGAGGAASAIAFSVADAGVAKLSIANRTCSKAEALAQRVRESRHNCNVSAGEANPGDHDIVVNATSIGMKFDDPLLLDPGTLQPHMLVADIVQKPEITKLLLAAKKIGCKIHLGRHMLDCQVDLIARYLADR